MWDGTYSCVQHTLLGELTGSRKEGKALGTRRQNTWAPALAGTPARYVTTEEALPTLGVCYPIAGLDGH